MSDTFTKKKKIELKSNWTAVQWVEWSLAFS